MLPTSTSDSTPATSPCVIALSRLRNSFRFCIVPPTAPIEHMLPMRSSGNVQSVQMRGREPPEPSEAAPAGAWPAVAAEGPAGASAADGAVLHDQDQRQRHRDHQDAEQLERRLPAEARGERVGDERHERAADADAEIGEAHRPAAAGVEPASRAAPGSGSGPPQT